MLRYNKKREEAFQVWFWYGYTKVELQYQMEELTMSKRRLFRLIDKWITMTSGKKPINPYTGEVLCEED